jgi:hypothetical protein
MYSTQQWDTCSSLRQPSLTLPVISAYENHEEFDTDESLECWIAPSANHGARAPVDPDSFYPLSCKGGKVVKPTALPGAKSNCLTDSDPSP